MVQEEKQELMIALCGYLPYGVICKRFESAYELVDIDIKRGLVYLLRDEQYVPYSIISGDEIKPYLRPMSSMTEEEKKILWEELDKDMNILDSNLEAPIINVYKGRCYRGNPVYHETDFLNKNHFDWRGLIPMGLALEAPEGMYSKITTCNNCQLPLN